MLDERCLALGRFFGGRLALVDEEIARHGFGALFELACAWIPPQIADLDLGSRGTA